MNELEQKDAHMDRALKTTIKKMIAQAFLNNQSSPEISSLV
jgi:hypothetical protein